MGGRRAGAGDRLVQAGALVFTVGLLFLLLAFVPAVLAGDFSKTGGYSLIVETGPYLVPLGLALALLGLLWQARASSRRFRRAAAAMAAEQEAARRRREDDARR